MGVSCKFRVGDEMLYKPEKGQFKDNCMIYSNGTYYLFSMYHKENSDKYNNIWLATSKDGIHFEDYGCVVEDFSDYIWAMKVYRTEDAYYINSGSFSQNGKQAVLKFWKSYNLVEWEYVPEMDIESPELENEKIRLDCMNVVKYNGKYYGYATGQYSFLTSDDGIHWTIHPANINYNPFPEYNVALGGFEVADCIEIDGSFYMFCGGFGHLGMSGYGVYLYKSENPDGPFTPCLPYYRINGTSKRWVNMWERFFIKDGIYLAHNYMYDGYSYEKGNVYLPPLKQLKKTDQKLCLEWWNGNNTLYGDIYISYTSLIATSPECSVLSSETDECNFSEKIPLPENGTVIEAELTLAENSFTEYSKGGIYLAEDENSGSAILFDTYGKCEIAYIKDNQIKFIDDTIGFGSTAPYYLESGKTYSIRILSKGGMFEIYVDDLYLQTFNNAHTPESFSKAFTSFGAISCRNKCTLSNIKVYHMI